MTEKKTLIRFFTIADFEEEEAWLREQHNMGWRLVKATLPCFYTFDRCEPEDVIYRLDFKNGEEEGDYFQMFRDYGWEYFELFRLVKTGPLRIKRPIWLGIIPMEAVKTGILLSVGPTIPIMLQNLRVSGTS